LELITPEDPKSRIAVLLITHCAVISIVTPNVEVAVPAFADPPTNANPVRRPSPVMILMLHPHYDSRPFLAAFRGLNHFMKI
jgi:hypothetical protein